MTKKEHPTYYELRQLRAIADFQFGKDTGTVLFPDSILIERSRATNRIRYVFIDNQRICSYRVTDGFLVLSLFGGELLHKAKLGPKVTANEEAEPFIRKGKSLFAKHVLATDQGISRKDEVLIVNKSGDYLGIGTAQLPSVYMLEMQSGVAVDTRKGNEEK